MLIFSDTTPDKYPCLYLSFDNWDDFSFKTSYYVTYFPNGADKIYLGKIKVGYESQEWGKTELKASADSFDPHYFSLGQDVDYYRNISQLSDGVRNDVLKCLNDIVFNSKLREKYIDESVMKVSLLRDVNYSSIEGQYKRALDGLPNLTEFNFEFTLASNNRISGYELDFKVNHTSIPPSNIHVVIGRNGVGKTHLLNSIVSAATDKANSEHSLEYLDYWSDRPSEGEFAGLVSVSFSAFDTFTPAIEHKEKDNSKAIKNSYVGLLNEDGGIKSKDALVEEFILALENIMSIRRLHLFLSAVDKLDVDPVFKSTGLSRVLNDYHSAAYEQFTNAGCDIILEKSKDLYKKMSSGHKIVLLTLVKLVEKVEESSLVLLDEPEGHLHPPLLSCFIRALSEFLLKRNAVAIIATHSPVVLQEVPKSCVWKINRISSKVYVNRPELETFGESLGNLTREVFGLDVSATGYNELITNTITDGVTYDEALSKFGDQLGGEARSLVRSITG